MKKWKFLLMVLLALALTGSWFAYTFLTASEQIGVTPGGADFAKVETPWTPTWTKPIFGRTIGSVEPVPLFYITPQANYTGDILVTVYLTNADELKNCYRYLNMRVALFDGTTGTEVASTEFLRSWEYLILQNGKVTLPLTYGAAGYDVKITGGCYYCITGKPGATGAIAPVFYCEVSER